MVCYHNVLTCSKVISEWSILNTTTHNLKEKIQSHFNHTDNDIANVSRPGFTSGNIYYLIMVYLEWFFCCFRFPDQLVTHTCIYMHCNYLSRLIGHIIFQIFHHKFEMALIPFFKDTISLQKWDQNKCNHFGVWHGIVCYSKAPVVPDVYMYTQLSFKMSSPFLAEGLFSSDELQDSFLRSLNPGGRESSDDPIT